MKKPSYIDIGHKIQEILSNNPITAIACNTPDTFIEWLGQIPPDAIVHAEAIVHNQYEGFFKRTAYDFWSKKKGIITKDVNYHHVISDIQGREAIAIAEKYLKVKNITMRGAYGVRDCGLNELIHFAGTIQTPSMIFPSWNFHSKVYTPKNTSKKAPVVETL